MYKNQLQELAQRSCFNLPSYSCIREGPDHAPRFKATVNFNGETFESPSFCTTLRQAEHAAAEVALNALSTRGPSNSLAARILDETGVYKNLLQEIAQRVGAPLPSYTTVRSGLGHLPVFTGTVELAGITFTGEPAKNKKQAEKNAAMAAWYSLKKLAQQGGSSPSTEPAENNDEQEQITIARALLNYRLKEKMAAADNPNATPFPRRFPMQPDKRPAMQPNPTTASRILPLIRPKSAPRTRPSSPAAPNRGHPSSSPHYLQTESSYGVQAYKFPAVGAAPYVPIRHCRPFSGVAPPPVTIRTCVPVFSAPPHLPPPNHQRAPPVMCSPRHVAPPVHIRQAVPVFAAPPPLSPSVRPPVQVIKEPPLPQQAFMLPPPPTSTSVRTPPPLSLLKSAVPAVEEILVFSPKPSAVWKEEVPPSPKLIVRMEKPPVPPKAALAQVEDINNPSMQKPSANAADSTPIPPESSSQTEKKPSGQNPLAMPPDQSEEAVDATVNDVLENAVVQGLKQIEL